MLTVPGTPAMVNSVNADILADRRVTKEYISEQLGIFVVTEHKICIRTFPFLRSVVVWVSQRQGSRVLVSNVQDCDIVVSEFKLQSRYQVHFRTNTRER